jgi:hypothetical protein
MRATLLALPLAALVGCDPAKPTAPTPVKTPVTAASADHDDHDHDTPGKHGGTVFDFGKHHAEFCVDHAKKEVTVYILSGNLKRNVAVAADKLTVSLKQPKLDVELRAVPMENDPKGQSSRFVGTHEAFGQEQEFAGTVHGLIDGKPFAGDFEEKPHDHKHDHK